MFWFFGREARGILAPWLGIEPTPPALESEVLTTGLPQMWLVMFQVLQIYLFLRFSQYAKRFKLGWTKLQNRLSFMVSATDNAMINYLITSFHPRLYRKFF